MSRSDTVVAYGFTITSIRRFGDRSGRTRSAHDIAQALWGNIAVTQAFLTLSEVLGHTDLLIRDGRVSADENGAGTVVFRAGSV